MKAKNMRHALFGSIVSLLLCCSMLVGTTFAWFTDSVTSGMNVIASGNLDIELDYYVDETDDNVANGTWKSVTNATDLFTGNLWEPGHTEVVYLRLRNLGSLALRYNFSINVSETEGTNVFGEKFNLSDYIYMGVVEKAEPAYTDRAAAIDAAKKGDNGLIGDGYFDTGVMLAGQEDLHLAVVVYMPEETGNEANYKTGTTRPEIDLGIKLYAIQHTYEEDSFDETYDEINTIADFSQYKEYLSVEDDSGAYLVVEDFTADNIIHWGPANVAMDLDDKTITAGNKDQYLFGAQKGGVLHLTGNGTANAGKGFLSTTDGTIIIDGGTYNATVTGTLNGIKHNSLVQKESIIVINGGTFTSNVADACLFFATSNGRLEVKGGFFENTATKEPDLFSMGTNGSNINRIVFTGGTFVNWNPLEDRMCYTGEWPSTGEAAFSGPRMLIPGGYKVVSEIQANGDVWYSVVPV